MDPCRRPPRARTMGIWTWSPRQGCSPPEQPPQHSPSQSIGNVTPRAALAVQPNTRYVSIYLDMLVRICQILSGVAPIGSWGGWAPGPPSGGGVMYRASRASDIRKQIQQQIGSGTMACDILRPAHDRPRPAPRPATESRCPSSPACEP